MKQEDSVDMMLWLLATMVGMLVGTLVGPMFGKVFEFIWTVFEVILK